MRRWWVLAFCLAAHLPGGAAAQDAGARDGPAAIIDRRMAEHWERHHISPAPPATDAEFLRRATLDLAGRIPTDSEWTAFLAENAPDKRRRAIEQLMAGPEFPLHFGRVLDELIQEKHAGHEPFVDYLSLSLRQRKSWDVLFRELMLGPWNSERTKPANRFLDRRAGNTDALTIDAARVFFGVDISCAQCHDHPLVGDWSQDHFYGMKAFFARTTGGKGEVGEKKDGEVTFLSGGEEKTAPAMFLSGRLLAPSAPADGTAAPNAPTSRRAQLVDMALQEQTFFSRAIVNRLWEYFLGRGLVDPIDQMHSENPPAVPGLLEELAEDFAAHGYDLHRLIEGLTTARVYQLSSRWEQESPLPASRHFAAARLRPLGQRPLAVSILLATGNAALPPVGELDRRLEQQTGVAGLSRLQARLALDKQAEELARAFDPRASEFQSSAREALFLSNAPQTQQWFEARDGNLPARLVPQEDHAQLARDAVRAIFCRPTTDAEVDELVAWLAHYRGDRTQACQQLVWSLVSSAEFRFNH